MHSARPSVAFSASAMSAAKAYLALDLSRALFEGSERLHGVRQGVALRGHRPGQDRLEGSAQAKHYIISLPFLPCFHQNLSNM
jgi:hypothetical protein